MKARTPLFFLLATLVYPLIIFVIFVEPRVADGFGAGFGRLIGRIFLCLVWLIASFFLARRWAQTAWAAVVPLVAGLLLSKMINDVKESYDLRKYRISKIEYYNSGKLRSSGVGHSQGSYDYDGEVTSYREDGTIKQIKHYDLGKSIGLNRYFYPNGILQSSGNDNSGHERDGEWFFYEENGAPYDQRTYNDGKLVASKRFRYTWEPDETDRRFRRFYTINGGQPFTGTFDREPVLGQDIDNKWNPELVPLYFTGEVRDGGLEGPWSSWTGPEKWALRERGSATDGRYDGLCTIYFPDGGVERERTFRDGQLEGDYFVYWRRRSASARHGKLSIHERFVDNQLQGLSSWYRSDGTLEFTREYVDDLIHGKVHNYDEKGKLFSIDEYAADTLVRHIFAADGTSTARTANKCACVGRPNTGCACAVLCSVCRRFFRVFSEPALPRSENVVIFVEIIGL